jgi:hypothetical protein
VENYSENGQELISSHSAMGCNMLIETSCSAFQFGFFSDFFFLSLMNVVKGSIRIFPKLKRGTMENGSPNMLADFYWSLIRETPTGECKRQIRQSEC